MSDRRGSSWSSAHCEQSIVAARQGSYSALGQLFDHYRDYLLRVANEELQSDLVAKVAPSDLVQETFLQATKDFPRFTGRTELELRAWLRQILVHELQDSRRRYQATQRRMVSREVPLDDAVVPPHDTTALHCRLPQPGAVVLLVERRGKVRAALEQLPAEYRRVLELRTIENQPFEQVGLELGRSAEAARRLWSRAIQRLAQQVEELGSRG